MNNFKLYLAAVLIQRSLREGSKILFLLLALSLLMLHGSNTADADQSFTKIYWTTETGKIQRVNLDGTDIEELVTASGVFEGIALDLNAGKMYWTSFDTGKIQRANLDGTDIEDLITGVGQSFGIALDVSNDKLYWGTSRGIWWSTLDGYDPQLLVESSIAPGVALDLTGGKLYGTLRFSSKIFYANLDGTEADVLFSTGASKLWGLALDVAAGKIYWLTSEGLGEIWRADFDGSEAELLALNIGSARFIALDLAEGQMYWAGGGKIQRCAIPEAGQQCGPGGNEIAGVIITGLNNPSGIALGI